SCRVAHSRPVRGKADNARAGVAERCRAGRVRADEIAENPGIARTALAGPLTGEDAGALVGRNHIARARAADDRAQRITEVNAAAAVPQACPAAGVGADVIANYVIEVGLPRTADGVNVDAKVAIAGDDIAGRCAG